MAVPMPEHVGHAPAGSLNVNWNACISPATSRCRAHPDAAVPLLWRPAQLFRLADVKAEQPAPGLQSVFQRRAPLPVDAGADDERIDHGLDRMLPIFVEVDMLSQVARLAVDPRP